MVSRQKMRNYWIYWAFQVSDDAGENVKTYLNKFITNNGGFSFIITQLYDELYYACITTVQCSDIKRTIEKKFRVKLQDAPPQELFPGAAQKKKLFKNTHEFRQFSEKELPRLNRPIITRKHKEAGLFVIEITLLYSLHGSFQAFYSYSHWFLFLVAFLFFSCKSKNYVFTQIAQVLFTQIAQVFLADKNISFIGKKILHV